MFNLFRENTRIAFDSIRSQLLRTILTVCIIGIGIFALVGILAAVAVLESTIMTNFASMGSNTFSISRYDFSDQIDSDEVKINPIISYSEAREFQDKFHYAGSSVSLS
ncbi:MAG TPA: ABC transporter permease, partial [Flavobacterium sp.]|nr:ABC transporter permease [Flavobacterium sp.]